MARLKLADTLTIELLGPRARRPELRLRFTAHYPDFCRQILEREKDQNLILKAFELFGQAFPAAAHRHVRFTLTKRVPLGAGLGGGSSNAASTLMGLARLFSLKVSPKRLVDLAGRLGSDVPFFIGASANFPRRAGPYGWATGRGERVVRLNEQQGHPVLVVYPGFGVSTPEAYAAFDPRPSGELTRRRILPRLLESLKDLSGRRSVLGFNSFDAVVFKRRPVLKEIKESLRALGAPAAGLTGSGSSLWAIAQDPNAREKWAERLSCRFKNFLYFNTMIA